MNDKFKDFLIAVAHTLPVILIAAVIVLYVIVLIKYAGKPVSELPTWVYIILKGD